MSLLDSTFDDLSNMAVLVSSTNPMMPSAQMTATTTNVNNLFDSNHTDSVNGLFSNETLDGRSSPDLWPERSKLFSLAGELSSVLLTQFVCYYYSTRSD